MRLYGESFCNEMPINRPEIIIIAALGASNRVIGIDGKLPWHLPADLKRFRTLTTGHAIIMGRKTWEECLEGRSLPNRHSIIVSRTLPPHLPQPIGDDSTTRCIVSCLEEAFQQVTSQSKAFIIGGSSIYAQTLERADRIELTLVDGECDGDAFFPVYEPLVQEKFRLIQETSHSGFQTKTFSLKN